MRLLILPPLLALSATACNPVDPGDSADTAASVTSVTVTTDAGATDWAEPEALVTVADETWLLSITDLVTADGLLALGPRDLLPGTVSSWASCPAGSEQPTEPCGDLVIDGAGWDLTSGTLTFDSDPVPGQTTTGSFDLGFVLQSDPSVEASAVGSFESIVGG